MVDTTNCKIPYFDPNEGALERTYLDHQTEKTECDKKAFHWTYRDENVRQN